MLNIGNKIRFGHQIYNVLKIKNDDILIENNNIVNCISKEELKNNLQKISFKKPSNLTESFKLLNEKLNVSLVYENDYVKIIARPIFEGFGASIYYHGSDKKNIKEFNTKSIFWTSEIEFAKNWGKYIYKAQLDIGKCFIFNERSHFNWLLKKVGKFSYEDANGNEQYFTNYNEYIKSPLKDNNWEIVEDYTDIIKTAYNSMQVTENGTKNYAVFENKQIKLIGNATPRNLDEGYVQRKSEFANTGVMFDDDYIEFEVGMSYIDENNIKWTITDIKTDADGDQICIVESEDGRYDRISALILNIDMFDLDTKKPVFDEKYFKQEDIKKANNISEHSEIIIYTNDKKYTKIYECNKLDAIKDFTSKFNFYNALVPQYLIKNGFLEESIHHASQWKDEQGDDVFFTILKNPTKKEFNDLLKNSKNKQLRAIVGPSFNDDIYVWDAYYGTHDDIFRRYIYPVDKKFRDGFANVMFRKNDYDIWGFTFSDWFNKLGYNSKDNSTNTIPKEKWEELYADDDLGLLDESVVEDKYKNQIKLDDGQWYHQKIIDNWFGEGTFNKVNVGDDIDFENKKINSNNSKELKQEYLLNDNFWKWFGNSKVVDVNGNPLICYHGSNVNIKRFDKNYCSLNTGNNEEGAFYFTSDKDAALDYSGEAEVRAKESEFYDKGIDKEKDWYAYAEEIREKKLENPTINPSFLQIENPYIYDFEGGMLNHSVRHTIIATLQGNVDFNNDLFDEDLYYDIINKLETYDEENDEYIQQESFDGVIFKNVFDNCTPMGGSNNIIDEYIVWNPSQIKSVYNKGLWSPYSENVDECLNENVENKKISEEDVKEFKQHYENHKNLVNKYASKINKQYPNHDADKFSKELLIPYIKGFIWGKMNCTDEEWKSFKVAQELHYRNNAHHSQHWDKNSYFKAPDVRGKMPDEALYEMCADWCAMSEYYGNTPFEWADENIGKLWKFDEHQIQVIYDTLHKMWDNSTNNINESAWYGNVNWQNNMDALGNVPATIGHNLFATMFPFQFLKLCPKYSYGDDDWFDKQVNERTPYGIPFLKVDVDEKNKQLIVTNHEGRHRVASIKRRNPNVDVPVAILYNKDRYILPDINTLRKEWSIISEDGKNKFNIGQFSLYNEFPQQSKHDLYDIYKENLNESLQTIETIHTPIYITNNVYDVIKLTNKIPSMRVLIDTNKNLYIIGNSLFNIHNQLFDYAIQAGYYNFKNQREKDEYWENLPAILIDENDYFSFDRKNDYFDDMIICKNFVVYYRTDDFLDTKLYKLLIEKYNGKHQINEMKVYAGSPTQYEKPSLIAIGSGEGNQAHGWGLYYALDRKVGEKYAKSFSTNKKTYLKGQLLKWDNTGVYLGNKKINKEDNETLYRFIIRVTTSTIEDYRADLIYMIENDELDIKYWDSLSSKQTIEDIKKKIKQKKIQLKLLDYIKQEPSYVYTCDIPENGYLYEDRTLNQQFPSIKNKLYKINNIFNLEFEDTDTGQEIYSKMVYAFETAKKASMVLLKYGIKGITYVGEQDGRCFVIFNPKDVQVLDVKRFNLNESLYFNEEVYDEYSENYIQLKVWKNPSAEWIRNTFNKTEYGAFRFVYNSQSKTLYVWDAGVAMHGAVMEYADVDGDIVGTLGDNNEVLVWPYISEDDDIDDAIEITKEKFGWFLKEIYGNIDTIKWGAND